jgi:hypothetical protein
MDTSTINTRNIHPAMAAAVAANPIQVPLTDKIVGQAPQPSLTYRPLHQTFGAEVTGADFGDVSSYPKLCEQVKEGLAKVSLCRPFNMEWRLKCVSTASSSSEKQV